MIARLLALVSGKATPWLAGAAVLLILGLAGLLRIEQLQRQAAETREADARAQLATVRDALKQRGTVIAALERQARAVEDMRSRLDPIRRAVNAAPRTTACVASPAVAAGLDRLRAARPAAGADRHRAEPAPLPARTAGP